MRYVVCEPEPRPRILIEHSLGQFSFADDKLYELVEVVSTLNGNWSCEYEWRLCQTSD